MVRMKLSLATLKDFDFGKAAEHYQEALGIAVRDCVDRPGESKARTVTLTTSIVPLMQQEGDVVEAAVDFKIASSVPAWKTATRPVAVTRQGDLAFNDMAPDNPSQRTLDEA